MPKYTGYEKARAILHRGGCHLVLRPGESTPAVGLFQKEGRWTLRVYDVDREVPASFEVLRTRVDALRDVLHPSTEAGAWTRIADIDWPMHTA
jgi:hypothetical protein